MEVAGEEGEAALVLDRQAGDAASQRGQFGDRVLPRRPHPGPVQPERQQWLGQFPEEELGGEKYRVE